MAQSHVCVKRLGGVWDTLTSFENLYLAWQKAAKGKRSRADVCAFSIAIESNLFALQAALQNGTYAPGAYRLFTLYERKPRLIAAAPFADRVVHHAILNVIEPVLDRQFIHHSYACRKGKGVHAAVDYYQQQARRHPYVLKLDIASYFPSVDHRILKQRIRHYVKDRLLLQLIDRIVDATPPQLGRQPCRFDGDDLLTPLERPVGLPIGNLTSQFLANLFLDKLDHAILERFGCRAYLRYVDDLMLLGHSKGQCHAWRDAIDTMLREQRLLLHPRKAHIYHTAHGIDCLGYQVFPHKRRIRRDNVVRFRRRLRGFAAAYHAHSLDWADFNPSVQSWIGHARHGQTESLREQLFSDTVFSRGPVQNLMPRVARRLVEQQTAEAALGQPQQQQAEQTQQQRGISSCPVHSCARVIVSRGLSVHWSVHDTGAGRSKDAAAKESLQGRWMAP